MKKIFISKQAARTLRKMQPKQSALIRTAINAYAKGEPTDVKPLKGSEFLRIRIGQWRIILDDSGVIITIIKIGSRGDVYKRGP